MSTSMSIGMRAAAASLARLAVTLCLPACGGTDPASTAHDAGDGASVRDFDEYGVWVDPGSIEERAVEPLDLRYGEPILLYATAEGVFRWDGVAQQATALLSAAGFSYDSEPSPDGDALLVHSSGALFVVPVTAGDALEVAGDATVIGWTADGERFVYVASDALWAGARSGGPAVHIADVGPDFAPGWVYPSPDGEWSAFMGFDGEEAGTTCHPMRVARSDGSRVVELAGGALEPSECIQAENLKWSADSRYVAMAEGRGFRGEAWSQIAVFDVESGERMEALSRVDRELTTLGYEWHPSESRLAYSDGTADAGVRLFDPRDATHTDLGRAEGEFRGLADGSGLYWDTHGEFIAFCTTEGLWQAELATGRTRLRMAEPKGACPGSLAPGGNWLAATVQDTPQFSRSVYRILAARGTHAIEVDLHDLPFDGGESRHWAPDGSRFAYVRYEMPAPAGNDGFSDTLYMVAPDGDGAVRFGAIGEDDGGFPLTWLWPDFAVNGTNRHSERGGLRLFDVALTRAEHVPGHALLGEGFARQRRQRRQRAFCSKAIVGGMKILPIDEDPATTAPGTGLDQLVLWWQDEPGGAWQQRVLDERPNDAPGECYIP